MAQRLTRTSTHPRVRGLKGPVSAVETASTPSSEFFLSLFLFLFGLCLDFRFDIPYLGHMCLTTLKSPGP